MDIYELFFVKMHKLGFPSEFKGYKVNYFFKSYQAELVLYPTILKLQKMWSLLDE